MNLNFLASSLAASQQPPPDHPYPRPIEKSTVLLPATGPQKTFSIKNSMIDIHQP